MFNNETTNFLRQLNKICNTVVLDYPITIGRTESSDVCYMVDFSKFDTDGFEGTVGIHNLSSFLSMFNLFGNSREVSLNNNIFTLTDGKTSANYLTTNIAVLEQFRYKKEQFDKLESFQTVLKCDLDAEDIKKLLSASSVFNLNTAVISCDESTVLKLTNVGEFKQSSNSFKIEKSEVADKKFELTISLDTLAKIPHHDYVLEVKYNEARNKYRIILHSKNIENFVLIIANSYKEEN